MTYKGPWPGTWATLCDECGFRFPSDKLKRRWDGLMVCNADYELRHPQDFIKVREETLVPSYTRPYPATTYVEVCTVITSQGIAGISAASCMVAGKTYTPVYS